MSHIAKLKGIIVLLFGLILMIAGCSQQNSNSPVDPDTGRHIIAGWSSPDSHGAWAKRSSSEGGIASCQECHGDDFSGGISNTACSTCHGASAPHPPAPWRGGAITHTDTNEGNAVVCAVCHQSNAGTPGCFNNTLCHADAGHAAGWSDPAAHGAAAKLAPSPTAMEGFSKCQECHGTNFAGGSAQTCLNNASCHGATVNSPHAFPWQSTSTRKHSTTDEANATVCGLCHLANRQPPSYVALTVPVGCFDTSLCHSSGPVGCINCHASVQTGTHGTPRDAVTTEFGLAWGHKKSGRGAVTDADCIVCHLEGEYATQRRSATYHGDGNIDLRNPDGTTGEEAITNNSDAAFTFTKFAFDTTTRTSAISNSVADVITQKFCLACHDSAGATNTTARAGSSPSATAPFGGGFTVLDAKSQFALTNSSRHPVLEPLNKDYPTPARLNAPYNGFTRTAGTKANGVVLNCFDCHNTPTTPLTTRTVAAHGASNTNYLRGTINVASPTLCLICHTGYAAVSAGHKAGSAFTITDTNMSSTVQSLCANCHASSTTAARPTRAEDVHGTNTLPTGGAAKTLRWLAGGVQGVPIAFMRNTTNLTNHQPLNISGTAYTPRCSMTAGCSNRPDFAYTPGGTY